MPVAPLNPDDFLHLLGDAWDEQRLTDFFRARPSNKDLDRWLRLRLPPLDTKDQLLWRTARAAHCFKEGPEGATLLIAIPGLLWGPGSLTDSQWASLGKEISVSLSYKLGLEAGQLELYPRPLSTEQAHELGATGWAELWKGVPQAYRLPSQAAEPTPFIWVGTCQAAPGEEEATHSPFLTLTPLVAQASQEPLLRAEALAEEQGARIALFPVTAAWNGPSFARLFGLRKLLAQMRSQPGFEWNTAEAGLELSIEGHETLFWSLPEETSSDIKGVLKRGT